MASASRPKAGDKVSFHFSVTGQRRLLIRDAQIVKVYPDVEPGDEGPPQPVASADLIVAFTPQEEADWGYASTQRCKTFAQGRRPISGEWTRLVY